MSLVLCLWLLLSSHLEGQQEQGPGLQGALAPWHGQPLLRSRRWMYSFSPFWAPGGLCVM